MPTGSHSTGILEQLYDEKLPALIGEEFYLPVHPFRDGIYYA